MERSPPESAADCAPGSPPVQSHPPNASTAADVSNRPSESAPAHTCEPRHTKRSPGDAGVALPRLRGHQPPIANIHVNPQLASSLMQITPGLCLHPPVTSIRLLAIPIRPSPVPCICPTGPRGSCSAAAACQEDHHLDKRSDRPSRGHSAPGRHCARRGIRGRAGRAGRVPSRPQVSAAQRRGCGMAAQLPAKGLLRPRRIRID